MFSISVSGAGQQCCYNDNSLIVGPPGGGTLDVESPEKSLWGHMGRDVLPWYACCSYSENCGKYYKTRPSDDGSRYVPPRIGKFISRYALPNEYKLLLRVFFVRQQIFKLKRTETTKYI